MSIYEAYPVLLQEWREGERRGKGYNNVTAKSGINTYLSPSLSPFVNFGRKDCFPVHIKISHRHTYMEWFLEFSAGRDERASDHAMTTLSAGGWPTNIHSAAIFFQQTERYCIISNAAADALHACMAYGVSK